MTRSLDATTAGSVVRALRSLVLERDEAIASPSSAETLPVAETGAAADEAVWCELSSVMAREPDPVDEPEPDRAFTEAFDATPEESPRCSGVGDGLDADSSGRDFGGCGQAPRASNTCPSAPMQWRTPGAATASPGETVGAAPGQGWDCSTVPPLPSWQSQRAGAAADVATAGCFDRFGQGVDRCTACPFSSMHSQRGVSAAVHCAKPIARTSNRMRGLIAFRNTADSMLLAR
ncbi:hypothetical protein [Panacagrimonas perspica]|uniref:hypothetical protein n=1 Tax=Panacagrimonas perspica TaxID=381431 RepID=UPI00105C6E9A|nr:hypothetical protein [Panacagrimonas perspica]